MKAKLKIDNPEQLVGMFVSDKHASNAYTQEQLQEIATSLGYNIAQVRDSHSMYDCMYNVKRLQIHVDDQGKIISTGIG